MSVRLKKNAPPKRSPTANVARILTSSNLCLSALRRTLNPSTRVTRHIRKDAGFLKADVKPGDFFILGGQTVYVAEVGEPIRAPNGEMDARLRAIYSNGTESNLLLRSLQRALQG